MLDRRDDLQPAHIKRAVEEYKERLFSRFAGRVKEMRLFGSHTTGSDRPGSDIDLLVLIDGLSWKEKVEALDLAADVSIDYLVDLSPLILSPEQFRFLVDRETRLALDILDHGVQI